MHFSPVVCDNPFCSVIGSRRYLQNSDNFDHASTTAPSTTFGASRYVQTAVRHHHKSRKPAGSTATPPASSNSTSPTITYTKLSATTSVTPFQPFHDHSHTQHTLHTTPPPRTYQPPPLPNDFVTSPDFHDCRVIFGHDLPKVVKRTAWSEKLGIAGCPIENTANAGSHETLMGLVLDPKRLPRPGNIPSVHAQCAPGPASTTTAWTLTGSPWLTASAPSHPSHAQRENRRSRLWQTNSTNI